MEEAEEEEEEAAGMTGEALHEIAYPDCVHATATCMFYLLSIRIQLWRINARVC